MTHEEVAERLEQERLAFVDRWAAYNALHTTAASLAQIFNLSCGMDFVIWHKNNWPQSSLAECRGPYAMSLLRMKAIQLGRSK